MMRCGGSMPTHQAVCTAVQVSNPALLSGINPGGRQDPLGKKTVKCQIAGVGAPGQL